jgi:hypothetical protein
MDTNPQQATEDAARALQQTLSEIRTDMRDVQDIFQDIRRLMSARKELHSAMRRLRDV